MNRHLSAEDQAMLRAQADQMVQWAQGAVQLVQRLHPEPGAVRRLRPQPGPPDVAGAADGALDLYDGRLRVRSAEARCCTTRWTTSATST
jgi:hypothetical protein